MIRLSPRMHQTLMDHAAMEFPDCVPPDWRPATMAKLRERGFVELHEVKASVAPIYYTEYWRLTKLGKRYVREDFPTCPAGNGDAVGRKG